MPKLPYFQFYPADWLSSPRIMCSTLVQQGAYIRLLCVCWMSGDCSIPNDNGKLAMLSGLPDHELDFVRQMFTAHPRKVGYLTNERLLKEWDKAHWISDIRSQAGKKSGKSRRTHVRHEFEQNMSKNGTGVNKSEIIVQKSEDRIQKAEEREEEKELNTPSAVKPRGPAKSGTVWDAYSRAYVKRYGVEPVRDKQANVSLCQVVDKLGIDAPQVTEFYLTHNDPFYVRKRHPPNLLALDATGLRTQWATGRKATSSEVRQAEMKDDAQEQVRRVEAMLERGL